ncbi:MAG: histidine kinase [Cypionkella sp.]|uniref:sensor histidine kinase n=1 Tax=Cypionkella sp. TaxID=2811411 RepID=UPI002AB953F9|nr:histidine kinase [Cypionkella sp.]MDZ4311075.1 histidine kinase [Cypionkella sp.]MDZ4391982.1 histidine kinase [Cypionkella sp.]
MLTRKAGVQMLPFEFSAWSKLSLARQFALAGGVVMLVSAGLGGYVVSGRIEEVVVRNTANATALYMESFIAPLTQDLAQRTDLSEESRLKIGALLADTELGKRVVSFKIWRPGGLIVDASNPDVVGKRFPPTENLTKAWAGEVRADFNDTGDAEDQAEHALRLPLLEIYSPIREIKSGKVIAVAEFYEVATQLRQDLIRARALGWLTVAGAMLMIAVGLFAVVLRGSRTIDRQLAAMKDLAAGNLALRLRVQGAAARFASVNDQTLRRIGADLHDGPAQLMGFAALRLDALQGQVSGRAAEDLAAVQRAVKDSILEIRSIARGLSLPDIEQKSLEDILRGVAEAHAARTGTAVALHCQVISDLPAAVKICCYRFVQEGLNNAWHHAEGQGQEVRVTLLGDQLDLQVLDRGAGFLQLPVDFLREDAGLGLAGLADRVESLGGHISFANRSDGPGAALRMVLDLKEAI